MSFVDEDFNSIPKINDKFANNYESGYSLFSRYFAILHSLGYLIHVRDAINKNNEE